jgi:hypothetical protein|tara:strand:- start:380 stop:580 length:201 start_codon:yes stop_codon:yes gene_type:complete
VFFSWSTCWFLCVWQSFKRLVVADYGGFAFKTVRKTDKDMHKHCKETSRGGLSTQVLDMPVNIIQC